jgi:hypothetical protein
MKHKYDNLVQWSKYEQRNSNVNELAAPLGNLKDNEENALDNDTNFLYSENKASGRHALEHIVPYNEDQDGISLEQYFVDAFSRLWKCVLRNGSAPTKTGTRIKYLTLGNQEALKTIALDLL